MNELKCETGNSDLDIFAEPFALRCTSRVDVKNTPLGGGSCPNVKTAIESGDAMKLVRRALSGHKGQIHAGADRAPAAARRMSAENRPIRI